jgi:formiminotetrahydrofolate cyclodeaminase
MKHSRTELQLEADAADLYLFRVVCRISLMQDRNPDSKKELAEILVKLVEARVKLRKLMHEDDRSNTR